MPDEPYHPPTDPEAHDPESARRTAPASSSEPAPTDEERGTEAAPSPPLQHGYERTPRQPEQQHVVAETGRTIEGTGERVQNGYDEPADQRGDATLAPREPETRSSSRERIERTGGAAQRQAAGGESAVPEVSPGEAARLAEERPEGTPGIDRSEPGQT